MAETETELKPLSRKNMLQSAVHSFGAVRVASFYVSDALSDLSVMEVGAADNNPLQVAKCIGSLRESLENLRILLDNKDNKPSTEKAIKELLK